MEVSKLVEKLEKELKIWRESHRKELQKELGQDFSIEELKMGGDYCHLENYFFPIFYKNIPFGVILPFRWKKKAIFASPGNNNIYWHASEVLKGRGYEIELAAIQIKSQHMYCLAVNE